MEFLAESRFETPADRIIISLDEPWSNEKQFVRFRSRITPLFRNFVSQIFLHLLRGSFKSGNSFPRSLENLSILSFISNSLFFSWTRIINRLFSPLSFSLYFIGERARRAGSLLVLLRKRFLLPRESLTIFEIHLIYYVYIINNRATLFLITVKRAGLKPRLKRGFVPRLRT